MANTRRWAVRSRSGRFGPYVSWGKINATLPKGSNPDALTLDEAVAALAAKASGVTPGVTSLGDHPDGGAVTVRAGRFGPYVNWGKVNANIPKSISPESITLTDALELLAEREGKPVKTVKAAPAKKAAEKKPVEKKPVAKKK